MFHLSLPVASNFVSAYCRSRPHVGSPFLGLCFVITLIRLLDWVLILVLDIGNTVIEQISLNTRILDALMQSVAVRAAGFVIIPLAALSPAVKVLFLVMMYISICV